MREQPIQPKIIMVGGTGRSGTSITKEIIALHPQAASLPFEYRFIIDPDGLVDFYTSSAAAWSPYLADCRLKRLQRFLKRLVREPLHHRLISNVVQHLNPSGKLFSPRAYHGWDLRDHLPNFEYHAEELISNLVDFSFHACWVGTESYKRSPEIHHMSPKPRAELASILGDFIRSIVLDLLEETGKGFFVEDNTWNVLFAKEITEILPDAKIIHVYRDPRDVVASFSHQRWSPNDKKQAAQWYKAMMTRWFDIRADLPPSSYYELSLEGLIAMPKEITKEICHFSEIDFDETMTQIDLSHSHNGRWKTEFSKEEKALVQDILGDLVRELGYE
jgi:hypothetical protein